MFKSLKNKIGKDSFTTNFKKLGVLMEPFFKLLAIKPEKLISISFWKIVIQLEKFIFTRNSQMTQLYKKFPHKNAEISNVFKRET